MRKPTTFFGALQLANPSHLAPRRTETESGTIDDGDYTVWKIAFRGTCPEVVLAPRPLFPEPAGLPLSIIAVVLSILIWPRRKAK